METGGKKCSGNKTEYEGKVEEMKRNRIEERRKERTGRFK
jgi:hypothetical protein